MRRRDPIWIGELIDLLRREDAIRIEVWILQWQIRPNVALSRSNMPRLIGPDGANLDFDDCRFDVRWKLSLADVRWAGVSNDR